MRRNPEGEILEEENPGRRILNEESWRRNCRGGILGGNPGGEIP